MSTGAVTPFTPNQPTQLITGTGTNQTVTLEPCDAVLLYNAEASGGKTAFIQIAGTALVTTGMPIPPGVMFVMGVNAQTKLGIIASGVMTNPLYITGGLGTQH